MTQCWLRRQPRSAAPATEPSPRPRGETGCGDLPWVGAGLSPAGFVSGATGTTRSAGGVGGGFALPAPRAAAALGRGDLGARPRGRRRRVPQGQPRTAPGHRRGRPRSRGCRAAAGIPRPFPAPLEPRAPRTAPKRGGLRIHPAPAANTAGKHRPTRPWGTRAPSCAKNVPGSSQRTHGHIPADTPAGPSGSREQWLEDGEHQCVRTA